MRVLASGCAQKKGINLACFSRIFLLISQETGCSYVIFQLKVSYRYGSCFYIGRQDGIAGSIA